MKKNNQPYNSKEMIRINKKAVKKMWDMYDNNKMVAYYKSIEDYDGLDKISTELRWMHGIDPFIRVKNPTILRRILLVIVFIVCFPLTCVMAFFSAIVMIPAAIIRWVITGDEEGAMDFCTAPFMWAVMLPSKICGIE